MSSKDINDAIPEIKNVWDEILNEYFKSFPGFYLKLTCVFRSPSEQLEIFKKGRTMDTQGKWVVQDKSQIITNCDGYKILSPHNYFPSRAIDVVVVNNKTGVPTWEESYYKPLIGIAEGFGLVSGDSWKTFKDYPHIEIKDYKNYRV